MERIQQTEQKTNRYGLDLAKLEPSGGGEWDKYLRSWRGCRTIEEATSHLYRLPHFRAPSFASNARKWPFDFALTIAEPPKVGNAWGSERVQETAMRVIEKLIDTLHDLEAVGGDFFGGGSLYDIRRIAKTVEFYSEGEKAPQFADSRQALLNFLTLAYLHGYQIDHEVSVPGLKEKLKRRRPEGQMGHGLWSLSSGFDSAGEAREELLRSLHRFGRDEIIRQTMNERVAELIAHKLEWQMGPKGPWGGGFGYMSRPQIKEYLEGYAEIRDQHPDLFWMMLMLAEWQHDHPARRAMVVG